MKRFLIKENKKGFTLIETFVAITILMVVVLGPMSLLSNALRDARIIGNEITATYLAQEGVELVIDYRNNSDPEAIEPLAGGGKDLIFDNLMPNPENCSGACQPLLLDQSSGYQYSTGGKSLFTRVIKITRVLNGQYLITSSVSWQGSPRLPVVSSSIIFKRN